MAFYFTFKSPFVLKIIKFLTSHFCHVHSISPHFFAGGDNLQCQILKRRGSGKKSVWRVLKSLCYRYLPGRGGGGAYYIPCQKRLQKMKYGFKGPILKCQSWPALAKQPINVQFCDILVLLHHLNNVTRN